MSATKPKRHNYDLHPCKGGWEVKGDGANLKQFERKADALQFARQEAKGNLPSSLRVHGSNGRLQNEYSYGSDPRRSRG
jgi:hypothetical protein